MDCKPYFSDNFYQYGVYPFNFSLFYPSIFVMFDEAPQPNAWKGISNSTSSVISSLKGK